MSEGSIEKIALNYIQRKWDEKKVDITDEVLALTEKINEEIDGSDCILNNEPLWTPDEDCKISSEEFKQILSSVGENGINLSETERKMFFDMLDANADGFIDYEEYVFLLDDDNNITSNTMWRNFGVEGDNVSVKIGLLIIE